MKHILTRQQLKSHPKIQHKLNNNPTRGQHISTDDSTSSIDNSDRQFNIMYTKSRRKRNKIQHKTQPNPQTTQQATTEQSTNFTENQQQHQQ